MAASTATFSFGAHSANTPSYLASASMISVLGVPGYAEAKVTPASQAPRAMASLPDRIAISGSFGLGAGRGRFGRCHASSFGRESEVWRARQSA